MIESNNITIGWIARFPQIEYVTNSSNPTIDGWPANGEKVTWRGYIKNWDNYTKKDIEYSWFVDGELMESGNINLEPQAFTTVDFGWFWTMDRHKITLMVDDEQNRLTVFSDAISLALYVEETFYNYFHENQYRLGVGSNSFEGWAQRQIRFYNEMFRIAKYELTPDGVKDRIRIDQIHIVPDNTLDNTEEYWATNIDKKVDLLWGFESSLLEYSIYSIHTSKDLNNQFYYSGYLQHELGHCRYLVDIMGFNVYHDSLNCSIEIEENNEPIVNTKYLQAKISYTSDLKRYLVHEPKVQGLMDTDWKYLDYYSAVALNLIYHHRAIAGNYNEPENIGSFLYDIPKINQFTLFDMEGNLLANANIKIYQASPGIIRDSNKTQYNRSFDNIPDFNSVTDEFGCVLIGENPFSNENIIYHNVNGLSNTVFIMRVEYENKVGYKVFDIIDFNMAYWKGNEEFANYNINIELQE